MCKPDTPSSSVSSGVHMCVALLLCWHCSDIKPANVLFGKSPYNSPAEQEELLRLLKIGALAAINVCSIIPSVSDFGGASKGGLARKPTSGYGTRMYRAPELKTAVAHPVVNMALADVFSIAITHLKLRYAVAGGFSTQRREDCLILANFWFMDFADADSCACARPLLLRMSCM